MRLALIEMKWVPLHSNTTSSIHHKWKEIDDVVCKQPMENYRGPTPTKCPIDLKDNSIPLETFLEERRR